MPRSRQNSTPESRQPQSVAPAGSGAFRDRVKELRRVRAGDLLVNPANWRTHPAEQREALREMLSEIGYAGALLARETDQGLQLIDGHLRAETTPDEVVPVLVLDVNEAEAKKLLATLDPLGAMAVADAGKLDELLRYIEVNGSEAVAAMLDDLAKANGLVPSDEPTQLKQLDTKPPPKMSWVLIGIPTVRYGEIAAEMERIGAMHGVVVETTVTD